MQYEAKTMDIDGVKHHYYTEAMNYGEVEHSLRSDTIYSIAHSKVSEVWKGMEDPSEHMFKVTLEQISMDNKKLKYYVLVGGVSVEEVTNFCLDYIKQGYEGMNIIKVELTKIELL